MPALELKAMQRAQRQKLPVGFIPAVAYNKDQNVSFAVESRAFDRVFREQGTHGLIEIALEGQTLPALVRSVQLNPRDRSVVHADFYLVTYGQEIEAPVPLHTTGRAIGVREGGVLDISMHNVNIIAPGPRRIPDELVVDVSNLQIGDAIKAGDLPLPEGCRLAVDPELSVVSVTPPQKLVVAEPTEEELDAQENVPATELNEETQQEEMRAEDETSS